MPLKPTGFWSYTSIDDGASHGRLSQMRRLLADQLQPHVGRQTVNIFQDVAAIPPGTDWDAQINLALRDSTFLIPIITPAFLQSEWCCKEVRLFHAIMRERGRDDLIMPVHYMDVGAFRSARRGECADPAVYDYLLTRQWLDFRSVRLLDPTQQEVRPELEKIAVSVRDTLYREAAAIEVPALPSSGPPVTQPPPESQPLAPPPAEPVRVVAPPAPPLQTVSPGPAKRSWVGSAVGVALLAGVVLVGLVAFREFGGRAPAVAPAPVVQTVPASPAPPSPVVRSSAQDPEMVRIPAGSFEIGTADEEDRREGVPADWAKRSKPRLTLTLAAFELARNTVTRGEFAVFVRANPDKRPAPGCWAPLQQADKTWADQLDPKADWEHPGFEQTDDHPVVCVSHDDAMAYIAWLNTQVEGRRYRLPTEAEWEYAARGVANRGKARFWGDGREQACTYANVADKALVAALSLPDDPKRAFSCSDGFVFTAPVRHFRPNDYGLYDMLGNVWQWTSDCWHENYDDLRNDGTFGSSGNCVLHVLRGGSWYFIPWYVRSGARGRDDTGGRSANAGFRLARAL